MKLGMLTFTGFLLAAAAAQDAEKDRRRLEIRANVEALPKLWADTRFWIETDGRKSGWVRYQIAREDFRGEPCLAIDYERATYLGPCERFRIYAKLDEFISPRGFIYGKSWREFRVEKGKVGDSPFGAPADPGNLVSFPEILATVLPFTESPAVAFSTMDHEEKVYLDGSMKYGGVAKIDGAGECHRFEASFTVKPSNTPERHEIELWVKPDRTLAKSKSSIKGHKGMRTEQMQPVEPKEWDSVSIELNEVRALAQVTELGYMYHKQRTCDLEGNGRSDEWVGDVSALYRMILPKAKEPIQVISRELAMADAAPLAAGPEKGGGTLSEMLCPKPKPVYGYLFKVMDKIQEKGRIEDLNDGTNRHEYYFAVCAFPAEYGKTGRKTFAIDWSLAPHWKDLKGKPAVYFPELPGREGWQSGVLK